MAGDLEELRLEVVRNAVVAFLVATLMGGFVLAYVALAGPSAGMGMTVPPVKGYLDGEAIRFIHTEASDPAVTKKLTEMMRSKVLIVPELARTPADLLAPVFVFRNGVKGRGPLGYQPDVFDRPPGAPGYRPLREVHLVAWRDDSAARELKSAGAVRQAQAAGQLSIERPGIVVNMPLLTWPGGRR